ncbi:CheR family methyltransferase [Pseudoduganella namucuonensis]|uniref:Chemotaxis protein methyltransferase CheR n=1 Tax=Pseudoduganella namucuonensis TaxID=1035707 RepID=A0A1I7HVW9_9BURK|nr:CheR family methyltransferase [Pseudoduganella namucuonensis]SFU64864.1 chemotaxis protein methyltransferase CheR [Pseudoduganella namucuonensis]
MGAVTPLRREAAAEVEELELELLLEALFQRYGYDFRSHERALLRRKLRGVMRTRGLRTLSSLQDRALHDPAAASATLRALHVPPATLFDDTDEARQLRQLAGGCLRGAALPRIWLADCAGAEQAWTLAVILAEEGLLEHTEIHATVASDEQLEEALDAAIPLDRMAAAQAAYARAGGAGQLASHFQVDGKRAVLAPALRSHITWAQYNLVTDASFNEFNLIACRRALPDFGPLLRQRVLHLFHESLAPFGILGLDRPLQQSDPLWGSYAPAAPAPWHRRIA